MWSSVYSLRVWCVACVFQLRKTLQVNHHTRTHTDTLKRDNSILLRQPESWCSLQPSSVIFALVLFFMFPVHSGSRSSATIAYQDSQLVILMIYLNDKCMWFFEPPKSLWVWSYYIDTFALQSSSRLVKAFRRWQWNSKNGNMAKMHFRFGFFCSFPSNICSDRNITLSPPIVSYFVIWKMEILLLLVSMGWHIVVIM